MLQSRADWREEPAIWPRTQLPTGYNDRQDANREYRPLHRQDHVGYNGAAKEDRQTAALPGHKSRAGFGECQLHGQLGVGHRRRSLRFGEGCKLRA